MNLHEITLTLFFTSNIGLKNWVQVGNFSRDLEIYKRLSQKLKEVNVITYGGEQDKKYEKLIDKINLIPLTWNNNPKKILVQLRKYSDELNKSDIFKTNQLRGSQIPLLLRENRYKKKLIVRCGFLYSFFMEKKTKNNKIIKEAYQLEKKAFSEADLVIITTSWQRDIIKERYQLENTKIKVIPNYTLPNIFKPCSKIQKKYDLVFIGRSGYQKNINNLLLALNHLKTKNKKVSLLMVGACSLNKDIRGIVERYSLDVTFNNNVPNFELPNIITQAKVFILPSYYEGHPKSLLEAMSCGMPCVGTDVHGIREEIEHMNTGYLCKTDFGSIAQGIEFVLGDEHLQRNMGKNARDFILDNYSIDKVFQLEIEAIRDVLST